MYQFHRGHGELLNISLQGSALLFFVYINYGNARVVICLIQWEDYLQEDCRIKPVSLDIFPMFEYWREVKWFQFVDFLTGTRLPGRPVGDLELWDSCALGLLASTRTGSGCQPLPSAKYLGLCLSLSRCLNSLDLSPCYSRTSTRVLRALPG